MLLVNDSGLVSESDVFQAVDADGEFLFLFSESLVPDAESVVASWEIINFKTALHVGTYSFGAMISILLTCRPTESQRE